MAPNAPELTQRDKLFQGYFTALAPSYDFYTGRSCFNIAKLALPYITIPKHEDWALHDNASGPGTAAFATLEYCKGTQAPLPKIIATDYTPAMIQALRAMLERSPDADRIQADVMNSQALDFPDGSFDVAFSNISVANYDNAQAALSEMRRTLKPQGMALLTQWKIFGFATVLGAAMKNVPGIDSSKGIPVAGAEFMQEGYVADQMIKAGWEKDKVDTHQVRWVISSDEDLKGAYEFCTSPNVPKPPGFPSIEPEVWQAAVTKAIAHEKEQHGGILCEAWVVVGKT